MARNAQDVDTKLDQLLQGMRVLLPGVTVLVAFLLTVPFNQRWGGVTEFQRDVYLVAILAATLSAVCLMAPAAQHRLDFDNRDSERFIVRANRYGKVGTGFLGIAIVAAVMLALDVVAERSVAVAVPSALAVVVAWAWFVQPLLARGEDAV